MSTQEIVNKLQSLPEDYRKKVEMFIDEKVAELKENLPKKPLKAGFGKGTFTNVSDDFDAPLDELKDYM